MSFNYALKYLLIGDQGVGKASICTRLQENTFSELSHNSSNVEFASKSITLANNEIIKLNIFYSSQYLPDFRSYSRDFYKGTVCAILVYDVTNPLSFKAIQARLDDCITSFSKEAVLVLVGNKKDLADDCGLVSTAEGQELAQKNKMLFFETSAKNNQNIKQIFIESAEILAKKIKSNVFDLEQEKGIKVGNNNAIQLDKTASQNTEKQGKTTCWS